MLDFRHNYYDGGEMLPLERYKLYNWVLEINPKIVFEVGTGHGGGSTYFISQAIKDKNSKLFTCDPHRSPTESFLTEFNFITYENVTSNIMISKLLKSGIIPDFIMFDGPEDPEVALNDIILLEKHIKNNTYFCMHDWDEYRDYDKSYSQKSKYIRTYIENSNKWELIEQLYSNKKNSSFDELPFDSVGICLYKFKS